jgi:cyclase
VPGHGPVVHATDLSQVLSDHDEYYGLILAIAEAGIAEGASPLQAAQDADLGRFAAWADSERIVLNLHRAYAELQDGVFDILAAITDTVTFNGGPMTTHVCCRS